MSRWEVIDNENVRALAYELLEPWKPEGEWVLLHGTWRGETVYTYTVERMGPGNLTVALQTKLGDNGIEVWCSWCGMWSGTSHDKNALLDDPEFAEIVDRLVPLENT